MTYSASQPARPLVVNLVGPSGVGKTTLTRALQSRDPRFVPLGRSSKGALTYHLLKNSAPLLGAFVCDYRGTRWFTWREMAFLAHVSAPYNAIRSYRDNTTVIVMMNGPLYQLARLRMFGPPLTQSDAFQRWHNNWQSVWSRTVDLMVRLDAPDHILLGRVNERAKYDPIKGEHSEDYKLYFTQQRALHVDVAGIGCFPIVDIDTTKNSVSETVENIFDVINKALKRSSHLQERRESATHNPIDIHLFLG